MATEVAASLATFNALFQEVKGRSPDEENDRFVGTLDGITKVAHQFQKRATGLRGEVDAARLTAIANDEQRAMLRAHQGASTAPSLMGVPTPDNQFPNAEFQLIAARRLLNLNLSHASTLSVCPAYPRNCTGPISGGQVDDAHLEGCGGILGGHATERHEALKNVLGLACSATGGRVALVDAAQDRATIALMKAAKVPMPKSGFPKGGDLLVRGLNGPSVGSKPTVIDVTVVSGRCISYRSAPCAADVVEKLKDGKHTPAYNAIKYESIGFGVDVGGRLGPSASAFLARLQTRWESARGKRVAPEEANWSCPSFTSYWRQRMVAAVQLHSASAFLERSRQMDELASAGVVRGGGGGRH